MNTEKEIKLITYEDLTKLLKTYMSLDDLKIIDEYYEEAKDVFKDMKRETGEDYIYHPIAVAYTLAELKMDPVTIGSALIHEAEGYAKDIGIQHILFHVENSNNKAFQLYERLGYKVYRDDGNRYMMIND